MSDFHRILVPLDGSPDAELSLPLARSLARTLGSEVILLHVLEDSTPVFPKKHPKRVVPWVQEARELAREHAESYLRNVRTDLEGDGARVRTQLSPGPAPARVILDVAEAEDVDLIVMCAQGRGAMHRWTLGGIADKVLRHCTRPVVFVPVGEEAELTA